MSSENIKEAALGLFALHGYEGTSLAQIAEQVGMKKQSIYSHFKGKDELFLAIVNDTFQIEVAREKNYLDEHFTEPLKDCLLKSLRGYVDRYQYDSRLKFWLRVSFFPPAHLYEQINKYSYSYIDKVDSFYLERFKKASLEREMEYISPETATMAYSALADSISVELVYSGVERTEKKLSAAWEVFWRGISS
ncbi:TetR/AcrR family transcriptional regulator [Oceanobacillus picturae]|uniref:TetR/AcrR family transcriptional regulator n=1 Tax=Oceanobacillus picturae TaxID=171693 RepID=UPI000E69F124|nr:TetR/AcrR family transcriptional regulator [Oceanobacillus picturae]RIU90004.1 TetR/AcrR family transcriptional regulator [Oceanobacillus picturae]